MRTDLNHRPRKRFGQNFLHDPGIIQNIIRAIHPIPGQRIVEIGPGQGAITEHLLDATDGHLDVVELDRDLIPVLRTKFFNHPHFTVHEADALKFDFGSLAGEQRIRVVGNLPYNISTPLLFHLMSYADHIVDMHFMLQKEVVQRICSAPGDKNYGRLSVMMQYRCETEYLFTVPPGAFFPAPKVDSAIVRLIPKPAEQLNAKNEQQFANLVRQSFSQRRKTLRNNLKSWLSSEDIERLDLDPGIRPEKLSVGDFVRLSNDCVERGVLL